MGNASCQCADETRANTKSINLNLKEYSWEQSSKMRITKKKVRPPNLRIKQVGNKETEMEENMVLLIQIIGK